MLFIILLCLKSGAFLLGEVLVSLTESGLLGVPVPATNTQTDDVVGACMNPGILLDLDVLAAADPPVRILHLY